MNLVFGLGEETRMFWDEVLLPEVHVYYLLTTSSYGLADLYKFDRNLNALYFALVEQLNLNVTEKHSLSDSPSNDAK